MLSDLAKWFGPRCWQAPTNIHNVLVRVNDEANTVKRPKNAKPPGKPDLMDGARVIWANQYALLCLRLACVLQRLPVLGVSRV
jgi:hypothetical protein